MPSFPNPHTNYVLELIRQHQPHPASQANKSINKIKDALRLQHHPQDVCDRALLMLVQNVFPADVVQTAIDVGANPCAEEGLVLMWALHKNAQDLVELLAPLVLSVVPWEVWNRRAIQLHPDKNSSWHWLMAQYQNNCLREAVDDQHAPASVPRKM